MYKYQIVIWWSEADQAFLAMAPQLPRCIMDGPTPEEAIRELNVVIDEWMESAQERGWPIPEPSGTMLSVRDEFDWKPLPHKTQSGEIAAHQSPRRATKSAVTKNGATKSGALRRKKANTKSKQPQSA